MATSSSQVPNATVNAAVAENDLNFYLPLYRAAIRGDWESADKFFISNPGSVTARINENLETVLHIAVGRSENRTFVENLVELMPGDALSLKSKFNETALHYAAKCGDIEAARLLVAKDTGLPHIWSDTNLLPLHLAALFGHKEMVLYLLNVTRDNEMPNPFTDQPGITLLIGLVHSGFYDVALDLVRRYPKLATTMSSPGGNTALSILAGKPRAFLSGSSLSSWQKLLYSCIPVKLANLSHGRDIGNASEGPLRQKFWDTFEGIVPQVKHIHNTKLTHFQAMELVKCLCLETVNSDALKSGLVFKPAVILAARNGLYEVIEEILSLFPSAIWCLDKEHHDLFQVAVINRRENIFNLLYDLDEHAHLVTQNTDDQENNILHLAGKLAPPHRLSLVAGVALQMQRELQWYKEVEKFVTPSYKGKENSDGKTPAMVFTEEHKTLLAEGERWLKDIAKSCTFAATLIATVVFAAAITVPGGSSRKSGLPIFQNQRTFSVFAVANAFSLFSSMTCVMMFLSILTSQCSEADFLYSLPNKLIIGLVNLFISLASMMVAFSSAIYAAFGDESAWILPSVVLLPCFPVTLFLLFQYPLLKDMIRSTYGPGIFGKKRKSFSSESGN